MNFFRSEIKKNLKRKDISWIINGKSTSNLSYIIYGEYVIQQVLWLEQKLKESSVYKFPNKVHNLLETVYKIDN